MRIKQEGRHFLLLTSHFFRRLFLNDFVDFEDQMRERVIGLLAILSVFSFLLTYAFLSKYGWVEDTGQSWIEKSILATFFMVIMSLLAVLEWETLTLDTRDFVNLMPLPVKVRTLLAAKFASLCILVGMFVLAMNALSTLLFVLYLPKWKSSSLFYAAGFGGVHLLSMFLACFFAFFINVVLIGLLMAALGPKIFQRLSVAIRSLFLLVHFFFFFLFIKVLLQGIGAVRLVNNLGSNQEFMNHFLNEFPAFWFVDLYETLLGNRSLTFHGSYRFTLLSLVGLVFLFVMTTGLSYKQYLRSMEVSSVRKSHFKSARMILSKGFACVFLRHPVQRAVFNFYGKTLKGSMFHKMRVASFLAVGFGFVLIQIVTRNLLENDFGRINRTMLSIPFVLIIFLLLGVRRTVNIPVKLPANWIFRLTEWPSVRHYFSGLRKGILFLNVLPLFIGLFSFYALFWDAGTALSHCFFSLAVAVLVMEVFFLVFSKIPFACSWLPGKEKIQLFWLLYLVLILSFVNLITWIELQLLRSPSGFSYFYGSLLFVLIGIRIYQVLFFYRGIRIQFEERLEPVMVDLSYENPPHKKGGGP